MTYPPRDILSVRLARLREALQDQALAALIVTYLPNIFYLTNFDGTAAVVVITSDRLYFITDFRYVAAFESRQASSSACPEATLVRVTGSYDETLLALLKDVVSRPIGIEAAHLSVSRHRWLSYALGDSPEALVPTEGIVERLRLAKDAHEIATLKRAAALLSEVALRAFDVLRVGRSERDIATDIDGAIRGAGFERVAFETIVATGPNTALPHARPGPRLLGAGDLVLLDFGGVYDGYCVDLTRTISFGCPDEECRRVHGAVAEAQAAALATVRPGVDPQAVDAAAREVLGRWNLADAFGHSTGHGLGIEVHEEPRIAPRRPPHTPAGGTSAPLATVSALEPGMVFTIEPGAYLPGWGGVRIEDDVLVTPGGSEVLTSVTRELVVR